MSSENGREGKLLATTKDEQLRRKLMGLGADGAAEVELVSDGQALLNRVVAGGNGPCVVLVDEERVLGPLRLAAQQVKVIYVAGGPGPEEEIRVRRKGIHFYLVKPVDPELLGRVVRKAIEHETRRARNRRAEAS